MMCNRKSFCLVISSNTWIMYRFQANFMNENRDTLFGCVCAALRLGAVHGSLSYGNEEDAQRARAAAHNQAEHIHHRNWHVPRRSISGSHSSRWKDRGGPLSDCLLLGYVPGFLKQGCASSTEGCVVDGWIFLWILKKAAQICTS